MIKDDDSVPNYLPQDPGIPRWLYWSYVLLAIYGVIAFALYWNGSFGWVDRGYWGELQEAANTTYPYVNHSE